MFILSFVNNIVFFFNLKFHLPLGSSVLLNIFILILAKYTRTSLRA